MRCFVIILLDLLTPEDLSSYNEAPRNAWVRHTPSIQAHPPLCGFCRGSMWVQTFGNITVILVGPEQQISNYYEFHWCSLLFFLYFSVGHYTDCILGYIISESYFKIKGLILFLIDRRGIGEDGIETLPLKHFWPSFPLVLFSPAHSNRWRCWPVGRQGTGP